MEQFIETWTEKKRKETLFLGISKCVRPMKKNSFHISDSVKALPSLAIILLVNRKKSVIKKKVLLQENCWPHNETIIEITIR